MRRAAPAAALAGLALAAAALAAVAPAAPASHVPAAAAGACPPRDPDGFLLAVPPYAFGFPRDHAAHPSYRTEWWYYTGHLRGAGRSFGYEVTFFRAGLPRPAARRASAWAAGDVIFLHLALTDETRGRFRYVEKAERAALGLAGADSTTYRVWLGADSAGLAPDGVTHRLRAATDAFALDLALSPLTPPVVHGAGGVSRKTAGAGNASHYYSLPRLATRGGVRAGADSLAVTGLTWMDHEFGSMPATHVLAGWDWFSVQLDDGHALMLYRLRHRDGTVEPLSSGTFVLPDGRARPLRLADFDVRARGAWTSPHTGGRYPSGWTLAVPGQALTLTLAPTLRDQELIARTMGGIAYWEGSVRVRGTLAGRPVRGVGYVELTGYAGASPF